MHDKKTAGKTSQKMGGCGCECGNGASKTTKLSMKKTTAKTTPGMAPGLVKSGECGIRAR